jgi:hypothetical protein
MTVSNSASDCVKDRVVAFGLQTLGTAPGVLTTMFTINTVLAPESWIGCESRKRTHNIGPTSVVTHDADVVIAGQCKLDAYKLLYIIL